MRGLRRITTTAGALLAVAVLAGCAPAATTVPHPVTVTATPSSSAPAPTVTATVTASTTPSPATSVAGKGCLPNGASIPAGADTARVGDVDETDSDSTEFYSEQPGFEFGVRTGGGAVVVQRDDLAGPATHSGWITRFPNGVLAVLDDGRDATLHAFVHCGFTTPKGVDGKPYMFTLNGFGSYGTGVECGTDVDGTPKLLGVNAVKVSGGYRIDTTEVTVSADGLTAKNKKTVKGTRTYAADGEAVALAKTSTCRDVPKVHTSGR